MRTYWKHYLSYTDVRGTSVFVICFLLFYFRKKKIKLISGFILENE